MEEGNRIVFLENVMNLISQLADVEAALEGEGFMVKIWILTPCLFGPRYQRDRVFILDVRRRHQVVIADTQAAAAATRKEGPASDEVADLQPVKEADTEMVAGEKQKERDQKQDIPVPDSERDLFIATVSDTMLKLINHAAIPLDSFMLFEDSRPVQKYYDELQQQKVQKDVPAPKSLSCLSKLAKANGLDHAKFSSSLSADFLLAFPGVAVLTKRGWFTLQVNGVTEAGLPEPQGRLLDVSQNRSTAYIADKAKTVTPEGFSFIQEESASC